LHITDEELKNAILGSGLLTEEAYTTAVAEAKRNGRTVGNTLIGRGDLSEQYLADIMSDYFKVPTAEIKKDKIDPQIVELLPESFAKSKSAAVYALDKEAGVVKLAMEDPGDLGTIAFVAAKLGMHVEPHYVLASDLKFVLRQYKRKLEEEFNVIIDENIKKAKLEGGEINLARMAEEVPVIRILDSVIEHAITLDASDVHFEPTEDKLLIRYRVEGIMREVLTMAKPIEPIIVARVKVLANLEIDEHAKPQDGRFRFKLEQEDIDIRVSVMPVFFGEKVEMRILRGASRPTNLTELGFSPSDLAILTDEIKKPHGMILSTGPTGSGKTTTLYAILQILNTPNVNITTIEDPIEYSMPRINQTQVNSKAGITFATGLRSLMRQNPDIILVGEIRDDETASIAVNAALTGHLVLSTLHTNDAPTAIPRFIDMGVQPFLIASTANVVIAQRLVRKICPVCIHSQSPTPEQRQQLQNQIEQLKQFFGDIEINAEIPSSIFFGTGCRTCGHSGYRGQVALFEVMRITESLRKLILESRSTSELRKQAIADGMTPMFKDGLRKVEEGVTTIDELLRVVRE